MGGGGGGRRYNKNRSINRKLESNLFFKEQNMIIGLKNVGFLFVSFLESKSVQNK